MSVSKQRARTTRYGRQSTPASAVEGLWLLGIPAVDQTSFSAAGVRHKGLTLKCGCRMKHTYPRTIRMVEAGQVDVRSLVTHCFTLDAVNEAFALAARRKGLKVVIDL